MKPLHEELPAGFEHDLLQSARAETPSASSRERARVAATSALHAATLGGAAGLASPSGTASAAAGKASAVVTIKKVVVGVLACAAAGAVVLWPRSEPVPAAPLSMVIPSAVAPIPVELPESPPPPAIPVPTETAPRRAPKLAPAKSLPIATPKAVPVPAPLPALDVAAQVQHLDQARHHLRAGQRTRALQLLQQYPQQWPAGLFLIEAKLLVIETLLLEGRQEEAAQRAEQFSAQHPEPAYRSRLERLLGEKR